MSLSNIQQIIERSINQALTKTTIAEGYLVDEAIVANRAAYETDMIAIAQTKGFSVEVFGAGSSQSKGAKRSPRIVINTEKMLPGTLGIQQGLTLIPNPSDPFTPLYGVEPSSTSDINIDIHLVSSTVAQDRVIHAIMLNTLGITKAIPLWGSPDETFFIHQFGHYDIPELQEGQFERVYSYQVKDVIIEEPTTVSIPVVPTNEITASIYISNVDIPKDLDTSTSTDDGDIFIQKNKPTKFL